VTDTEVKPSTIRARVEELLADMTLAEKAAS